MGLKETLNKIEELTEESKTRNLEKKILKIYNQDYEEYDIGCIINYLIEKGNYEVYIFIGLNKENAIGNILLKIFNNEEDAYKYYLELVNVVDLNDLDAILNKILEAKN